LILASPRLTIASTKSSSGKTLITAGLARAFIRTGLKTAAFKIGPDFIDPTYLRLSTKSEVRNLDLFFCNPEEIASLVGQIADNKDLLLSEGVMGLFDGTELTNNSNFQMKASTAQVSKYLGNPVILIIDAAAQSQSAVAELSGFLNYDKELNIAGVIFNNIASDYHREIIEKYVKHLNVKVLGYIKRNRNFILHKKHLGLVPAMELKYDMDKKLDDISDILKESLDLNEIFKIAKTAPTIVFNDLNIKAQFVKKTKIAVSSGKAFSFFYDENYNQLKLTGAQLSFFDPTVESFEPDSDILMLCGGFPENHLDEIADNRKFLDQVKNFALEKKPIWAECAGLMILTDSFNGRSMAGVINAISQITEKLKIGYAVATTLKNSPLLSKGATILAHEHHYGELNRQGDSIEMTNSRGKSVCGYLSPNLFASFLHLYLGNRPDIAMRLVKSVKD
jgi:cobyrinic acid a,c-diamide synthase